MFRRVCNIVENENIEHDERIITPNLDLELKSRLNDRKVGARSIKGVRLALFCFASFGVNLFWWH